MYKLKIKKNFKTCLKNVFYSQVSFLSNDSNSLTLPFSSSTAKRSIEGKLSNRENFKKEGRLIRKSSHNTEKYSTKKNSVTISRIGKLSKKVIIGKGKDRLSEYQSQYKAKQLIKKFYGNLSESELINLNKKNKSNLPLICLIERRLDVVVFRLGFARSIHEARYLINTKQIKINNKFIRHPNFLVLNGSIITTSSVISHLSRLLHLKLNFFKLPSHLFNFPSSISSNIITQLENSDKSKSSANLIGLFIKDPLEAEVYLPYDFPLEKFNYFINKY